MFTKLAASIAKEKSPPFEYAVVDEAQDLTVAHLRFFARSAGTGQTVSSLQAISGNEFFNSLSPGSS